MLPYWYYTYLKKDEKPGISTAEEEKTKMSYTGKGNIENIKEGDTRMPPPTGKSPLYDTDSTNVPKKASPVVPPKALAPEEVINKKTEPFNSWERIIEKNIEDFYEQTTNMLSETKNYLSGKIDSVRDSYARRSSIPVEMPGVTVSETLEAQKHSTQNKFADDYIVLIDTPSRNVGSRPDTENSKKSLQNTQQSDEETAENLIMHFLSKTSSYFSKPNTSVPSDVRDVKIDAVYKSLKKTEKEINQALAKTRKMISTLEGAEEKNFVLENVADSVTNGNNLGPPSETRISTELLEINKKMFEEVLNIRAYLLKRNEDPITKTPQQQDVHKQTIEYIKTKDEENDYFRGTWIRYLGFANEFGEASKYFIPSLAYKASYTVTGLYIIADVFSKAKNASQKHISHAAGAFDALLWQSFATIIIPGITINRIVWYTGKYVGPSHSAYVRLIPSLMGLLSIPIIVSPIDRIVTFVMNKTVRKNQLKQQISGFGK